MSDWDEIKRLAADFQKIQLSSTLQKLSEPNCIEVVNLLVEQQLINVIYTIDGKEYITPEHFRRELEDELYVRGGRANAVTLAKTLNVDLSRVNLVAEQMARDSADIHFVLGQLMTDAYLQRIAAEINDTLAQKGSVSVFELASGHFDLPTEFLLQNVMQRFLGTVIHARQDSEDASKFFTAKYIARCRARLRGATAGLTLPTPVAAFMAPIGAQDAMYHQLLVELGGPQRGTVTSRQKGALYVPNVYTRTQDTWALSSYNDNGYLEYDAVARLGVAGPQNYIKRQLAAAGHAPEDYTLLSKCCVSRRLVGQLEAAVEECIATGSYLDATTVLPSAIAAEDIEALLAQILKQLAAANKRQSAQTQVFGSTILTTKFIEDLVHPCAQLAATAAKTAVESGQYQQYLIDTQLGSASNAARPADTDTADAGDGRKDDRRRKATGGKAGGGSQGRETKTKSTKKHFRGGGGRGGAASDSDDETPAAQQKSAANASAHSGAAAGKRKAAAVRLDLVSAADIQQIIRAPLDEEGLKHLAAQLAEHFAPQFNRTALATAQTLHEASKQGQTPADRRQTHAARQERLNNWLVDIRLYERGLRMLPVAQQPALAKYLLKSLATDVSNDLHAYVAAESGGAAAGADAAETKWTPELRAKVLQDGDASYRSALGALNKTLAGTSVEEFLGAAEAALQACSMILKKIDKKRDRTLIMVHKHGLIDQLNASTDPALVLHLAVLTVFTVSTQSILHASGKHVQAILGYLKPVLSAEQGDTLRRFQDLVLKLLVAGETDGDNAKETLDQIADLMPLVKEVATSYQRVGVVSASAE